MTGVQTCALPIFVGRAKAFEAIVKGTDIPTPKVPESFKVLIKELQSLGLNVVPMGAVEEKEEVEIKAEDAAEAVKTEVKDLEESLEAVTEPEAESGPEAESEPGDAELMTAEAELIEESKEDTETDGKVATE